MEKSTKIKLRMLQVAKNKGISYEKFFKDFGTSYANFKGKSLKSSLRSIVLVDFSSKHPDVDLNWLITGEEKQQQPTKNINIVEEPTETYLTKDNYITHLEKEVEYLRGKLDECHSQNNTNKKDTA